MPCKPLILKGIQEGAVGNDSHFGIVISLEMIPMEPVNEESESKEELSCKGLRELWKKTEGLCDQLNFTSNPAVLEHFSGCKKCKDWFGQQLNPDCLP